MFLSLEEVARWPNAGEVTQKAVSSLRGFCETVSLRPSLYFTWKLSFLQSIVLYAGKNIFKKIIGRSRK